MQKREIYFCKKRNMWALKLQVLDCGVSTKPLPTEYVPSYKEAKNWLDGKTGNGNCYESAAKMMFSWDRPQPPKLCHGIVRGQGGLEGGRFGHAWIEYELELPNPISINLGMSQKPENSRDISPKPPTTTISMVVDHSNGKKLEMPRALYYNIGDIRKVKTYDKSLARKRLLEEMTYGPWQ